MQLWQLETLLLQKDAYIGYSRALSYPSQALNENPKGLWRISLIGRMSCSYGCLQTIAAAIVIGVTLHVRNHLTCDFPRLVNSSEEEYKKYLNGAFGDHKPSYGDLVLGIEGLTGILMVSMPFGIHYLFVIVYMLLIIHGINLCLDREWTHQTTWMYLVVPILLYAGERTLRFFRSDLYSVNLIKASTQF
ncbi:unnamed protein product [Vicia faba]|uniref:Uncharacterized protein n=1 Tax=Vicia faba TaxID=3906 RepID=A0AAV0YXV2_VICFA|nr:unnamed protein product [Vicia faba]